MIRVQFNGENSRVTCEFKRVNNSNVKLIGDEVTPHTNGFVAYRLNGDLLGDYSDFKKCTKVTGGYKFTKVK